MKLGLATVCALTIVLGACHSPGDGAVQDPVAVLAARLHLQLHVRDTFDLTICGYGLDIRTGSGVSRVVPRPTGSEGSVAGPAIVDAVSAALPVRDFGRRPLDGTEGYIIAPDGVPIGYEVGLPWYEGRLPALFLVAFDTACGGGWALALPAEGRTTIGISTIGGVDALLFDVRGGVVPGDVRPFRLAVWADAGVRWVAAGDATEFTGEYWRSVLAVLILWDPVIHDWTAWDPSTGTWAQRSQ
jgi:hypothetical protein